MRTFIISLAFFTFTPVAFAECVPTQANDYCIGQPGTTNPTINNNQVTKNPTINNNTGTSLTLINPLKGVDCSKGNGNCLSAFLIKILEFVIQIGTVVVVLMLVYVGFLFVVAQGKEEKIREARSALLWTVVGALVLLGSQAIASGIQATVQSLGG